jgi:stearoyl-CoA desaturase (delta-9 desaturase)
MFLGGYFFSCLGITLSYHRQLTHKSFETDKWLEHAFAFLGVLAVQGHPIEWVSAHRHHHVQCDDVPDPHSPYDGFFWSHMGWLFDSRSNALLFDTTNAKDMKKDDFYVWLKKNYLNITIAQPIVYFLLGGFPGLIWGFALRTVFSWHVTWAVNSISHMWGRQMFKTGDISMNNPVVGILALGEGWHNNHHAFEDSCRHGLKWW